MNGAVVFRHTPFRVTFREFQGLVIALHPQTQKHIRGGWSRYTDTSEPDSNGAQNIVTVQSGVVAQSIPRPDYTPGNESATFRSLAQRAY
jgi:hypothetical protein